MLCLWLWLWGWQGGKQNRHNHWKSYSQNKRLNRIYSHVHARPLDTKIVFILNPKKNSKRKKTIIKSKLKFSAISCCLTRILSKEPSQSHTVSSSTLWTGREGKARAVLQACWVPCGHNLSFWLPSPFHVTHLSPFLLGRQHRLQAACLLWSFSTAFFPTALCIWKAFCSPFIKVHTPSIHNLSRSFLPKEAPFLERDPPLLSSWIHHHSSHSFLTPHFTPQKLWLEER